MNINIKKEETNRLEDFIKNEEESLKARELVSKKQFLILIILRILKTIGIF